MADDKLMDAQLNDDELADVAGAGTGIDPDAFKPFDPNDPINILIQKEQEAPSVSPIPGPDEISSSPVPPEPPSTSTSHQAFTQQGASTRCPPLAE